MDWIRINDLGARQHNLLTVAQLRDLGVPYGTIRRKEATGQWHRVHPRVVSLVRPAAAVGTRAMAAVLQAGPPVWVTGEAGLYLHRVLQLCDGPIDLLMPATRRLDPFDGVRLHRSTRARLARPRLVGTIPTASATWCLLDLGRTTTDQQWHARAAAKAIAERKTTLDTMTALHASRGRYRGAARSGALLHALAGGIDYSATERRVRRACQAAGLGPHPAPLSLTRNGRTVAEADIAFIDVRLDVEIDGPHHFLPGQAAADRVRDRQLRAIGWEVLRFSVYEVDEDLPAIVREIAAAIRDRAARIGA